MDKDNKNSLKTGWQVGWHPRGVHERAPHKTRTQKNTLSSIRAELLGISPRTTGFRSCPFKPPPPPTANQSQNGDAQNQSWGKGTNLTRCRTKSRILDKSEAPGPQRTKQFKRSPEPGAPDLSPSPALRLSQSSMPGMAAPWACERKSPRSVSKCRFSASGWSGRLGRWGRFWWWAKIQTVLRVNIRFNPNTTTWF